MEDFSWECLNWEIKVSLKVLVLSMKKERTANNLQVSNAAVERAPCYQRAGTKEVHQEIEMFSGNRGYFVNKCKKYILDSFITNL